MSFNIEVEGGSSVRLPTAGKYCDMDIIIKALGGGGGGASGIYMAKVTPASNTPGVRITHNLGTKDILLAAIFVESFGDNPPPDTSENLGNIWAKADMPAIRGGVGYDIKFTWAKTMISNNTAQTAITYCTFPDENTVYFYGASPNMYFLAGVTHTVIIIPASAFKETEG